VAEPRELEEFLTWKPGKLVPILSKGIMYEGTRVFIYGRYKTMKSMLALRFALAVSRGCPWLGFDTPVEGRSVMLLQLEIPEPMLHKRVMKMVLDAIPQKQKMWIWTEPFLKLDTPGGWARINQYLTKYQPQVLILDPIYKLMSGDLTATAPVQKLTSDIDRLMAEHPGLAIMLVHHTRKESADATRAWGSSDDMYGNMIFSAWADSLIRLERGKYNEINVEFPVLRHAEEEIAPMTLFFNGYQLDFDTVPNIVGGQSG